MRFCSWWAESESVLFAHARRRLAQFVFGGISNLINGRGKRSAKELEKIGIGNPRCGNPTCAFKRYKVSCTLIIPVEYIITNRCACRRSAAPQTGPHTDPCGWVAKDIARMT